ncbi:MAG: SulP family inorganic anion transporter [Armatimonadota bacterium]
MDPSQPSDGAAEAAPSEPSDQGEERSVLDRLRARLPSSGTLSRDGVAGLNSAISNVPDGMANAVVVGVSPAYGLYAAMLGPGVGGLFSSTQLMMITTTAAASLATGQALAERTGEARAEALFLVVLLAGAFQVLFGWLGMGRLIRFVSFSVMTGFLTGVSVLLILSQLSTVTGYAASGSNRLLEALDLLSNLPQVSLPSLAAGILTLGLALYLPKTRIGNLGRLVAVIVPSVLIAVIGMGGVQTVADVGEVPRGLPLPAFPSLALLSPDLLTGALAVATIILVQGAGVSQIVSNPDGSRSDLSRDFVAEGAANVASGLCQGLPVGGSVSATALNRLYGGRSRWSVVLAGVWMAVVVLAIPGLVAYTAMPALGALLILAGASSIRLSALQSSWRAGWPSRVAGMTTFLAMLFLPIQAAVGIGVALSALLYLYESSTDVSVVELVTHPDGRVEERRAPRELPSARVTVLDVYGHLFYAGAYTLERLLPRPEGSHHPAVILRLRGRGSFGATLIDVLTTYAERVEAAEGRLYLTGLSYPMYEQVIHAGKLQEAGTVRAYGATPVRGDATRAAIAEAEDWLTSVVEREEAPESASGERPPR